MNNCSKCQERDEKKHLLVLRVQFGIIIAVIAGFALLFWSSSEGEIQAEARRIVVEEECDP